MSKLLAKAFNSLSSNLYFVVLRILSIPTVTSLVWLTVNFHLGDDNPLSGTPIPAQRPKSHPPGAERPS